MHSTPSFSLRVAFASDILFLESLRKTTMRTLIEKHYAWCDEAQRNRVLAHFESAKIISVGRDVSLFKVVHNPEEVHLSQVQLLPEMQGKGIASALIRQLQEATQTSGVPINLKVIQKNRAIELYRRLGFVVVREGEHFLSIKWSPIRGSREGRTTNN